MKNWPSDCLFKTATWQRPWNLTVSKNYTAVPPPPPPRCVVSLKDQYDSGREIIPLEGQPWDCPSGSMTLSMRLSLRQHYIDREIVPLEGQLLDCSFRRATWQWLCNCSFRRTAVRLSLRQDDIAREIVPLEGQLLDCPFRRATWKWPWNCSFRRTAVRLSLRWHRPWDFPSGSMTLPVRLSL